MKIISHRGRGIRARPEFPFAPLDNYPSQIDFILRETQFDIEVDIRTGKDGNFYYGHDSCKNLVSDSVERLLNNPRLWLHCKNIQTFTYFAAHGKQQCNYFFHETDDATLTSNGLVWVHPTAIDRYADWYLDKVVICANDILPGELILDYISITDLQMCHGICTDYPEAIKDILS